MVCLKMKRRPFRRKNKLVMMNDQKTQNDPNLNRAEISSLIKHQAPTPELINHYLNLCENCSDVPRTIIEKPDVYQEVYWSSIKNSDKSLTVLISKFPKNNVLSEIFLKVVAINSLYSTNIFDTYRLAYHIFDIKNFDQRIRNIDSTLVEDIARGHGIKEKRLYSFATKYCSWHNMNYPIYDGYIERLLTKYLRDKKVIFKSADFRNYDKFIGLIESFRKEYGLTHSIKEIDKFLWLYAKTLDLAEVNNKAAIK